MKNFLSFILLVSINLSYSTELTYIDADDSVLYHIKINKPEHIKFYGYTEIIGVKYSIQLIHHLLRKIDNDKNFPESQLQKAAPYKQKMQYINLKISPSTLDYYLYNLCLIIGEASFNTPMQVIEYEVKAFNKFYEWADMALETKEILLHNES